MIDEHKTVVLGANGFLGSHVTKALVRSGRKVRAHVRSTSEPVENIAGLDVEMVYGDALDKGAMVEAIRGCESVFHCVVDTRAWLHDPTPLYRVNIDGLRNSMEAALQHDVKRFVFTSTVCTIGRNPSGVATEADAFNWKDLATHYVLARVEAENLFMDFCRRGLPGVACNVAMTWGEGDFEPTPHGRLLKDFLYGRFPFYWDMGQSMVDINDAAEAMILAEEKGRFGERYIIATRYMTLKEVFDIGAQHTGWNRFRVKFPMPVMYVMSWLAQRITRMIGRETRVNLNSLRLSFIMSDFDSTKAKTELGWKPRSMEESIREAADWYVAHP
jgi:dihydroflavonol-4-reductase